MQLKPEALNALKLPVKVKAGFLGSVKLKVCGGFWSHKVNLHYVLNIVEFSYEFFTTQFNFFLLYIANWHFKFTF